MDCRQSVHAPAARLEQPGSVRNEENPQLSVPNPHSSGAKHHFVYYRSCLTDLFELAHQWMGGIDFVVPVGADQQQIPHIGLAQQILEQIKRGRVEPLQIVIAGTLAYMAPEQTGRMNRSIDSQT